MTPGWRKSARSKNYGDCVEAGQGAGAVLVRDTRAPGTVLRVPAAAWAVLCARLREEGR